MGRTVVVFSPVFQKVMAKYLQMKHVEKILKARTSIRDLSRKDRTEDGAADSSGTGLEASEHGTKRGETGAPPAPPLAAAFIRF